MHTKTKIDRDVNDRARELIEGLDAAIAEAERFTKAAKAAIAVLNNPADGAVAYYGSKPTAAARRASLDLSAALSAYRGLYRSKPWTRS